MPHEVESMFSVREKPWHYAMTKDATKIIQEAPNSQEALIAAGLDWTVQSNPIYTESGLLIPGYKVNTRNTDNATLGVVSDRYKVVQNSEAFAFTDELIGEGCKYETAGSLRGGKTVWMLAQMPEKLNVVGDEVDPYICFSNTHDGSSSVRVMMTPVRVVCNNTLNLALNSATRAWSTRHIGDIDSKLEDAKQTLGLAQSYMKALDETGDYLANTRIDEEQIRQFLDTLFKVEEGSGDRAKANAEQAKTQFMACYFAPDIAKFQNTAWGVVNAASDFATHTEPKIKRANSDESRWANTMNGNIVIDTTFLAMMNFAKAARNA